MFFVTFGNQYRDGSHPRGDWIHPDGYVTIVSSRIEEAREEAFNQFGTHWSFMYDWDEFDAEYYPLGELARITP